MQSVVLFALTLLFAADASTVVQWRQLRALDMTTGKATDELKKIDNTTVRIAGYMVPLENDDLEEAAEYLIVPIAGGCIHTPPPPPNQIVYCRMINRKKAKIDMFVPQWFEGKFNVAKTNSPYGAVAFQMSVSSVQPYTNK